MYPKYFLSIVVSLLLVANCYIIFEYDQELSRWARLVTTSILFAILLWKYSGRKRLIAAFSFLLIADVLLFFYEDPVINSATFVMRIAGYLTLVMAVAPELRNLQTSLFQKVLFLVVFSLNIGMLYMLVDMVPDKFYYPYLNKLFYVYGTAMIILVIAAISYSNRYSDSTSFFFTAGALGLVFSDITSFIAYYLDFSEFYFPDRIFYIIGIASIVKFASFNRSHEAVTELESL